MTCAGKMSHNEQTVEVNKVSKSVLRKIKLKSSEGSIAKSPFKVVLFPPLPFLILITILIITIEPFFYFIFVIKNKNRCQKKGPAKKTAEQI